LRWTDTFRLSYKHFMGVSTISLDDNLENTNQNISLEVSPVSTSTYYKRNQILDLVALLVTTLKYMHHKILKMGKIISDSAYRLLMSMCSY